MGYMQLAFVAWRNLWRNRRRTLITLSSIAFACFMSVLFSGIQDWQFKEIINTAARLGGGHVTLQHSDYQKKPGLARTIGKTDIQKQRALKQRHVVGAVDRIVGQTMLSTSKGSYGAGFVAYDPKNEGPETLSILEALDSGELFAEANDKGIILGHRLAKNLGAKLGDKVVYTLTDKNGDIVSGMGRVKGLVKTGSPSVDLSLCFLPIDSVRQVLGYQADEATQVAVFIDDQRKSPEVAQQLSSDQDAVSALTWKQAQPDLDSFIAMKVGGMIFFEILILVLCAAGIFNTLFVSVMERLREFGILLAIGLSPNKLFAMVMWESLWLALCGLVGAVLLSAFPYYYLSTTGLDFSKYVQEQGTDIAGVGVSLVMKIGLYPETGLAIALAAVLATLAAGIYPALKAGRVEPVESIKLV